MGALRGAGQIASHNAQNQAIESSNRGKLRNFDEQNKLYRREVMLDRAEYKNDMALADIDQDKTYRAMIDQWSEQDQQLDKLFAEGNQKIEQAIVKMYKNDYAGTQTGKTAARLAGQSARELGQYKAGVLHKLMMAEEETDVKKDTTWNKAQNDSRAIHEKVRFAPIHGPTPVAPELEAKKGSAGLILGLAGTALGAAKQAGAFKAPAVEDSAWTAPGGYDPISSFTGDGPQLGISTNLEQAMNLDPYESGTNPWS